MSEPDMIPVTAAAELVPGQVRVVGLRPDPSGRPREALVLRDATGTARAYLNRCRHIPIPIDGGSRKFLDATGTHLLCGTHGALYRLGDGLCVGGPCVGKRLEALGLQERDGTLYLLHPRD